jgi:hypothetical protein
MRTLVAQTFCLQYLFCSYCWYRDGIPYTLSRVNCSVIMFGQPLYSTVEVAELLDLVHDAMLDLAKCVEIFQLEAILGQVRNRMLSYLLKLAVSARSVAWAMVFLMLLAKLFKRCLFLMISNLIRLVIFRRISTSIFVTGWTLLLMPSSLRLIQILLLNLFFRL